MDPNNLQDTQDEGPGTDDVIIQLLKQLVEQGKSRRAESVMAPATPVDVVAPADDTSAGDDAHMSDLEQMLADKSPQSDAMDDGGVCPKCGKPTAECAC